MRRPSGYFIAKAPDGRTVDEGETLTCSHCGLAFRVQPGSGRSRGWCLKCNAATCGGVGCHVCAPFEKQVAEAEQRHALWRTMER